MGIAALAWIAAWLAPMVDWIVGEVTWLPLLAPEFGRLIAIAMASVAVLQVVRHWRRPAPDGDVRTISLPVARCLCVAFVGALAIGAVNHAAMRLDGRRGQRVAAEIMERLDAGDESVVRTSFAHFDQTSHEVHRVVVGQQDSIEWSRRREAIWVDALQPDRTWEHSEVTRAGWSREFAAIDVASRSGRWYLMTTTWHSDCDAETGEEIARARR